MKTVVGSIVLCFLTGLAGCGDDKGAGGAGSGGAGAGGAGSGGAGSGGAGAGGAGAGGAGRGGAGAGGAGAGGAGSGGVGGAGSGGAGAGGAGAGGAGAGGAGAGGAGAGGAGAGGAGAGGSGACNGTFAVTIDGAAHTGCVTTFSEGGLNHVIATLDDDYTLVVNIRGQVPAADACVGLGLRPPMAPTTNAWIANDMNCVVNLTEYGMSGGGHVRGTFDGTAMPGTGAMVTGTRMITNGSFDVTRM